MRVEGGVGRWIGMKHDARKLGEEGGGEWMGLSQLDEGGWAIWLSSAPFHAFHKSPSPNGHLAISCGCLA